MYLWIEPWRCENLENSVVNESVTSALCSYWQSLDNLYNLTEDAEKTIEYFCQVWGNTTTNTTNEELASRAGIRMGAIQVISDSMPGNFTLEDGVTQIETNFMVVAKFDQTGTVVTR